MILKQNWVTTRKPHQCWGCGEMFPSKTLMIRVVKTEGTEISAYYFCESCEEMIRKFPNPEDMGLGDLRQDKTENSIKIFEVSHGEYYAARTKEEAIRCAMLDTEESREFYFKEYEGEVTEKEMDNLTILKSDEDDFDNVPSKTFREKLKEMISEGYYFPAYFATNN